MSQSSPSSEIIITQAESIKFCGLRFTPTDAELISHYLKQKINGVRSSDEVISEIDICKYEPWELPVRSLIPSDNEWFFFSPRGRKYRNGSQSRRATKSGYWKATGKERMVKSGSVAIGTKRTLVFHNGRAPRGERTEWIIHEYCLNEKTKDFAVCRLRRSAEFHTSANPLPSVREKGQALAEMANEDEGHSRDCSTSSSRGCPSDILPECDLRPLTEFSVEDDDTDDCFTEILKNNIVNLDEYIFPETACAEMMAGTSTEETLQVNLPFQGTASRRLKLEKRPHAFVGCCGGQSEARTRRMWLSLSMAITAVVVVMPLIWFSYVGV